MVTARITKRNFVQIACDSILARFVSSCSVLPDHSVIVSDTTCMRLDACVSFAEQGLWAPFLQAVMAPHQLDSATSAVPTSTAVAGTQIQRRGRQALKPGEWDPAIGDFARKDIARRSLLQNMYYCVAQVPAGGLREGQLYEASAMGKSVTFWQGVPSLPAMG